jgi:nucleoside-diphosphate-sugar epimerase
VSILVTGGTGFVGAAIAELLVQRDDEQLILFDLFPNADAVAHLGSSVRVVRGDFSEPTELVRILSSESVTSIVHLGYYTSESEIFPGQAIRVNCGGTNSLFEVASAVGVRRIVWASSAAVYGAVTTSEAPQWRSEKEPPTPNSIYGACKLFNEHVAEVYAARGLLDPVGLRLCSVFGKRRAGRRGIPADFYTNIVQLAGSGEVIDFPPESHMTTWAHVDDVARAFYNALRMDSPSQRVYNIGGAAATAGDAARAMQELRTNTEVRYGPTEVRHLSYLDGEAAARDLGYEPSSDLKQVFANCLGQ